MDFNFPMTLHGIQLYNKNNDWQAINQQVCSAKVTKNFSAQSVRSQRQKRRHRQTYIPTHSAGQSLIIDRISLRVKISDSHLREIEKSKIDGCVMDGHKFHLISSGSLLRPDPSKAHINTKDNEAVSKVKSPS